MRVVTAPDEFTKNSNDVLCFLAGGITDCVDWQQTVISILEDYDKRRFPGSLCDLVVFNPRRSSFDVNDKSATDVLIEWEFKWLQLMDLFTMYFAESKSDLPICLYELGRNVVKMALRFPETYDLRTIVSYSSAYSRAEDVQKQLELASSEMLHEVVPVERDSLYAHAMSIARAYKVVKRLNNVVQCSG